VTYQIRDPEGYVNIEYEHLRDDFWEMITRPVITRRTLEVSLRGEVGTWDGAQRPAYVAEQLALPPTPGYTGIRNNRPVTGE
jgi:hypothetical protein